MMSDFDTDDVLLDVQKSGVLGKSKRQYKLLEYLLNQTKSGKGDRVKAYIIAVDLFDRPSDFDDKIDSIVRVEMHRLRKNLQAYSAKSQKFSVEIPKASFRVTISEKPKTISRSDNLRLRLIGPVLLVTTALLALVFSWVYSRSAPGKSDNFARDCSDFSPNVSIEVLGKDTVNVDQVYLAATSTLSQHTWISSVESAQNCYGNGVPAYHATFNLLEKGVNIDLQLNIRAIESNALIYASKLDRFTSEMVHSGELMNWTLKEINHAAKPWNFIMIDAMTAEWQFDKRKQALNCIKQAYDAFGTNLKSDFHNAVSCGETAIENGVASKENLSILAYLYILQDQKKVPSLTEDPLDRAKELLDLAAKENTNSFEYEMARIEYLLRVESDPDFVTSEIEQILKQYNYSSLILLTMSRVLAFQIGEWEKAIEVDRSFRKIHYATDDTVFHVFSTYAMLEFEQDQDLEKCLLTQSKGDLTSNMIILACALKAENNEWISRSVDNFLNNGIEGSEDLLEFMRSQKYADRLNNEYTRLFSNNAALELAFAAPR